MKVANSLEDWSPGDKLRRPKKPFGWHYGLFGGWDKDGKPFVYEMVKKVGGRKVDLEKFANGEEVEHIPYTGDTPRGVILDRARRKLGEPYGYLNANCEHFVNYCQNGEARSQQVSNFLSLAVIVGLGYLANRS